MSGSQIRIRVGASIDSSVDAVFAQVVTVAKRARDQVAKEMGKGAQQMATPYRTNAKVIEGTFDETAKAAKRAADAMTKDVEKSAKARVAAEKQATKEIERELTARNRAAERAEREQQKNGGFGARTNRRIASYMGQGTVRNLVPFTPTLSIAKRAAGDIARGAGIKMDAGSLTQSFVSRQKLATDIANTGYITSAQGGRGENARQQDPNAIMAQASAVAKSTALDAGDVLGGLQQFVKLTGDLETGRAVLSDMAKLSRATGTNISDMVDAAGAVAKNLGNVGEAFGSSQEKAAAVNEVMRQMAVQGKIGSVDISDLSKVMSKVASAAGQLSGTSGADKVRNIGIMGALTQESRGVGGASSPAQSARAAASYIDMMKTPARMAAFKSLDIKTQDASGKIRGPDVVIAEALAKTHGDTEQMSKLFKGVMVQRAVTGFSNVYKDAYANTQGSAAQKNAAGQAAYKKELAQYTATMTDEQVNEAFAKSMEDAEAKAQNFQNQLQDIADAAATKIIPALEDLAPKLISLVGSLGKVIEWAAANPGGAIAAALAASVMKAGIETVLRSGVEAMVEKALAGGALGGLGGALGLISIAAATIYATKVILDDLDTGKNEQKASIKSDEEAQNLINKVSVDGGTEDDKKRLEEWERKKQDELQANLDKGDGPTNSEMIVAGVGNLFSNKGWTGSDPAIQQAMLDNMKNQHATNDRLRDTIDKLHSTIEHMKPKPIQDVRIVSGSPSPTPGSPPNAKH
jgi:hypothetical protein